MKFNFKTNKKGAMALSQILILIIGTIAIAYAIGSEMKNVSAESTSPSSAAEVPTGVHPHPMALRTLTNHLDEFEYGEITNAWSSPNRAHVLVSNDKGNYFVYSNKDPVGWKEATPSQKKWAKETNKLTIPSSASTADKEGFLKNLWGGKGIIGIIQDFGWAMAVWSAIKWIGPILGVDQKQADAVANALALGFLSGRLTWKALSAMKVESAAMWGWGVGIGVAILVYLMFSKEESKEVITFECMPWQAPLGGAMCEECNKDGILPCNEYKCRSLGQGCELENVGSGKEACIFKTRKDVKPPIVTPRKDALPENYIYIPDNAVLPPNQGVKIINQKAKTKEGCVPPFTPITFGVETNEPARCKLDYVMKRNFTDMDFWFGGSNLLEYNHTQSLILPGPSAMQNASPLIKDDGLYQLFTRCQDANGNVNEGTFSFKFCVDKGPDTTPPLIVSTSILNGMPIGFNQTSVNLDVMVNEPANCKWSTRDQLYDKMENEMSCAKSVFEVNAQMLYKCKTTLTGLKNKQDNIFYFRCKDLAGNENKQSQPPTGFKLIGTQLLVIDKVTPNGTIKDSTEVVKVNLTAETSFGYKDGQATCYYSESGKDGTYIAFLNSGDTNSHSQELNLIAGSYSYFIKCVDLGGNTDEDKVSFKVETDTQAPKIVRAYKQENYLKLVTDEKAECAYNTDMKMGCKFVLKDATSKFQTTKDIEHYITWTTGNILYIKCMDIYGNEPRPDECSLIAKPSSEFVYVSEEE